MKEKNDPNQFADLRHRAEEAAQDQLVDVTQLSTDDIEHLIHELQVRQIELEMQNEELRWAQQQLEESRDKYAGLYNFAPVGYFTVAEGFTGGKGGLILEANLTGVMMLGVDRDQLLQQPFSRFVAWDDKDVFYLHRKQVFEAAIHQTCELKMVKKDGSEFWAHLESVREDDGGEFSSFRMAVTDITERVQARVAVRETHAQLNATLDALPDLLFVVDRHGRFYDFRATHLELLYVPPEQFLGKTVKQVLPPEEAGIIMEAIGQAVETGQHTGSIISLETPAVGLTWYELSIACKSDPHTPEGRLIVLVRNITKHKQAEEERERLLVIEHEQRLLAETLQEVTLALTSQISHKAVLDEILRQVQRLVPYNTASISLLEDGTLRIAHWRGYEAYGSGEMISNLVQPLADFPLDARVVQAQQPLVISDVRQEPDWVTFDQSAWIRSTILMPIFHRGHVLGLLRLDSDKPGEFYAEAAERLQPLANAAAIALENTRLYEQAVQDAQTKIALLNEVNHRVKNSLAAIIGLLYIEKQYAVDEKLASPQTILDNMINRIQGLATVHHLLSEAEWSPLPVGKLAGLVINSALQALPAGNRVSVDVSPSSIQVTPKLANSLALIINDQHHQTCLAGASKRSYLCPYRC